MEVVLVRWPAESQRRARLVDDAVPRLLLLDEGAPVPSPQDCLEDWVRVPVEDHDLQARITGLAIRAGLHLVSHPELDDDGVLRVGEAWVPLPPVESRLAGVLLEKMGVVVSREALARAGWPEGAPGRNALDVHVLRLRRRLAGVGLAISTVRSRGYLLERSASRQERVQEA
jgi:DNA-binding response OmpR family regulator